MGSIRAGLALQLKQSVGVANIMKEESKILKYVEPIRTYVCMLYVHVNYRTYSGKFSMDKIFADGSENENVRIKFSQMLAYHVK